MARTISVSEVRSRLLTRRETALFDVRSEAVFATGHPLFATTLEGSFTRGTSAPSDTTRLASQLLARVPHPDAMIVVYDDGEQLAASATKQLETLGYTQVYALHGGLSGWRDQGFPLFQDVNSYSKAFGELVESRKHTPMLSADELHARLVSQNDLAILDARRFDEYNTMSIPGSTSVPGAELVLRVRALAPDPETTVVVNCAGRTRSILGAQSLINAGVPNPVFALRNGTIGWTLAGRTLETGQLRRTADDALVSELAYEARTRARAVAYRAGVKHLDAGALSALLADRSRTLYRFDVRSPEDFADGHLPGFESAPGGQLVQECDMFAPVRGARIVLSDIGAPGTSLGVRADMTASWLAQMAWEVYVLEGDFGTRRVSSELPPPTPRSVTGRYKRPYEGTDNPHAAMQAYLDWEYGLVAQLERDATHGFFAI